ncbi:TerC family protein [Phreatobacter stygius]|uniref:TerC family protein n=1 Tax=Phreatobacter stygius TaxID=1940610 RepID=A0A4D7B2Z9_9HYPH|nr:TerC family protein [Phreatobacter stygius]QCI65433.1 TerC family protein [Phreatobacter stygius]
MDSNFWIGLLQIIWIDLLLSGDNAVVIALACRGLPEKQRKIGIILGAGAAVGLRILFALIITYLLAIPLLKLVGGLLLLWVAVKLASDDGEEAHSELEETDNLWKAVKTVAIADAVMSLDNVLAIAAASHGNVWLFIFGLALTIPLIVAGSGMVLALIERFPIFVWAGAALLGWIAGDMVVNDPLVLKQLAAWNPSMVQLDPNPAIGLKASPWPHYIAAVAGAIGVVLIGAFLRRRPKAGPEHA